MTIHIRTLEELETLIEVIEKKAMSIGTKNEELDAAYRARVQAKEARHIIEGVIPQLLKISAAVMEAEKLVYDERVENATIRLIDDVIPSLRAFLEDE